MHIHIIALSKANCHSENKMRHFEGYNLEFSNTNGNAKNGEAHTIKTDITVPGWDSIWIEPFNIPNTHIPNCNITSGAINRSPSACANTFIAGLDNTLHNISQKNSKIILCGNINIDLISVNSYKLPNSEHTTKRSRIPMGLGTASTDPCRELTPCYPYQLSIYKLHPPKTFYLASSVLT